MANSILVPGIPRGIHPRHVSIRCLVPSFLDHHQNRRLMPCWSNFQSRTNMVYRLARKNRLHGHPRPLSALFETIAARYRDADRDDLPYLVPRIDLTVPQAPAVWIAVWFLRIRRLDEPGASLAVIRRAQYFTASSHSLILSIPQQYLSWHP